MGGAYFFKGQFEEAASKMLLAIQDDPGFPPHTGFSPRAMPIWGGSMKRAVSSAGCAPLLLTSYRTFCPGETPSTANCCCPACAWREARRDEPDPPPRRDPRRRCCGYSRLIGEDEEGTLNRLRAIRADLIDPKISEHRGSIVKTTGDGLLVEFTSVVDALRCATQWQHAMRKRGAGISDDNRIEFHIGVHQGDVVVEDEDIFGDGVNVAARLEGLAEPGGICVSARV
jgi:hypothetical protein